MQGGRRDSVQAGESDGFCGIFHVQTVQEATRPK
jgi:hypothetical protein